MFFKSKFAPVSCLALAAALSTLPGLAPAAEAGRVEPPRPEPLQVVRTQINAETENAELCLEFNAPLASRAAASVQLERNGKKVTPRNVVANGASLCLFPLDRNAAYNVSANGLRGSDGQRMAAPYALDFTIPDRTPTLAFSGNNGGLDGFASYETPLNLRGVNVAHTSLEIYRVTAPDARIAAWQNRAQATLAPMESAYLARTRGERIKQQDLSFDAARNAAQDLVLSPTALLPDAAPGLYLFVVGNGADAPAAKPSEHPLAPMAAVWVVRSDFALTAVADPSGLHAFAASPQAARGGVRLTAFDAEGNAVATGTTGTDGTAVLPPPEGKKAAIAAIAADDGKGNIAFADPYALPEASAHAVRGTLSCDALFPAPGEPVSVSLSLPESDMNGDGGVVRLLRDGETYYEIPVAGLVKGEGRFSLAAPPQSGAWVLRWQKADGTVLAETTLHVTTHPDAPRLQLESDDARLSNALEASLTVRSLASGGKPIPLAPGRIRAAWEKSDPAALGWKDYRFGSGSGVGGNSSAVADFITDEQGLAKLDVKLPPPPAEPGLYQAVLTTTTDPDTGIGDAAPLTLPLRNDSAVVGIKPLAPQARFAQNNRARFALIAVSSDGKPRDLSDLSFQVYEEGRSFAWYQDEGRWKYRREPQLRPIGGGQLTVKSDGSSVLEWPVAAGNYRLEILDANGKTLAQTAFSAGWGARAAAISATPLTLEAPPSAALGHETTVRFTLPEKAMVTAIVDDGRVRKAVHELRDKGPNSLTFIPAGDWRDTAHIWVRAQSALGVPALRGETTISLSRPAPETAAATPLAVTPVIDPAALTLRAGDAATLVFDFENRGTTTENPRYTFAATGLKLDGATGALALAPRASRALPLTFRAEQAGAKTIKLDLTGERGVKLAHSWQLAVLPNFDALRSGGTVLWPAQQPLPTAALPARTPGATVIVARRPMDGFAELASYVLAAEPFTTRELSFAIPALRAWRDTLAQTGLAPDFYIDARRGQWVARLLKRQNADGGFAAQRPGVSTLADTAAAVTALAGETDAGLAPMREAAIGWLKQKLANTWFDDAEREQRARIYAALAAAKEQDVASLHYFSDTSVDAALSPEAKADIAAAFKQIRDPDAAAFWVKKLLTEKSEGFSPALLSALAATDALSSDETRAAAKAMAETLGAGQTPPLADAAALLVALAADNGNAGKAHAVLDGQDRGFSTAWTMAATDGALAAARNDDAAPLYVTLVRPFTTGKRDADVTRHIYRSNGVELAPGAQPARGETYLVELTGTVPTRKDGERTLIHDGDDAALRPLTCALPPKTDMLAFMPWFTAADLTPLTTCETTPYTLDAILPSSLEEGGKFRLVYFARLESKAVTEFAAPQIRVIK